jgi:GAF domain-containing protein
VTDSHGEERHDDEELLELLGSMASELSEADELHETMQRVVDLAEQVLDHCDGVSLMLIGRGGRIDTPAASSQTARDSDLAQYETGEGPCLDAIEHQRTIVLNDLEEDERWPAYRAKALELGVRSMLGVRLFASEESIGALDLYSRRPQAFDERSQVIAQVFAIHASIAVKAALTIAGLETVIGSRDVIGQAKGIIMSRHRVTADMAFELLKTRSQELNRPVRDLAREVVDIGDIPSS